MVHDIVAAIEAEEAVYNMTDDPEIQDASWHRLRALQIQLSAAVREARGAPAEEAAR